MADSAAVPGPLPRMLSGSTTGARAVDSALAEYAVSIVTTSSLTEVEPVWRQLEAQGVESPGQTFDFIRLWVDAREIPADRQLYITASLDGAPVALLPLHRKSVRGVRQLAWFPGPHVGCNAPLIDAPRLAAMSAEQRSALWRAMLAEVTGADLLYLKSVPQTLVDGVDIFAELGTLRVAETLYRAEFGSWEEAKTKQWSKSRRKHDRQQGEKLAALGEVAFEEIGAGEPAFAVLDVMFRQRAARFVEMGVPDPFAPPRIRRFYDATVSGNSAIDVKLHVLRLNGDVVAVRYNVIHGDRMFCLISSMSDDQATQAGSPGKQCLLRVMQGVFDTGFRVFDMGSGFTDEKRHWCNVQIPVRQHYLPLTRRGGAAAAMHRLWQMARTRIKSDRTLMSVAKTYRQAMLRITGKRPETECE